MPPSEAAMHCEQMHRPIWTRIETVESELSKHEINQARDMTELQVKMRVAAFWGSVVGTGIGTAIVGGLLALILKK
jgi:hypothetical protein